LVPPLWRAHLESHYRDWKTEGTGDDPKTEGGAPGAAGSAESGSESGPLMVGAGEGAAKGAGIRRGKGLMVGGGGAKFSSGLGGSRDCALAAASGTTARVKAARTRMSCRMMRCSIAVPWRRSSYAARIANGRGRYCVVHGSQLRNFAQSSAMPRSVHVLAAN
jgi:hypothetical protein